MQQPFQPLKSTDDIQKKRFFNRIRFAGRIAPIRSRQDQEKKCKNIFSNPYPAAALAAILKRGARILFYFLLNFSFESR